MLEKKQNKQHDARAASFKRIAKAIRKEAKLQGLNPKGFFVAFARVFDDEAKLLRSMR